MELPKRLRSVEKKRTSTCRFADLVAECVLAEYRALVIPHEQARLELAQSQTCISGVVLHQQMRPGQEQEQLRVVSIGVGTRIVSEDAARQDEQLGELVLDSHAEVLARRAFVRYLYGQLAMLKKQQEEEDCIFCWGGEGGEEVRVKPGITLHLYSSSSPCGNSCVRRWAKGQTEHFLDQLGPNEWPTAAAVAHSKLHVHHPLQVAVLCKVRIGAPPAPQEGGVDPLEVPPGTALCGSAQASSRASCSDKVARWCHLGMQGTLLGALLGSCCTLVPSTVVVGRKFSRPHLERALCCRAVADKKKKDSQQHHAPRVQVLCTSVQVHHGGFEDGAKFCDYGLVWWRGERDEFEVLQAGKRVVDGGGGDGKSAVSRASLFALYCEHAAGGLEGVDFTQYAQTKQAARTRLPAHQQQACDEFFANMPIWPRYLSVDD